MSVERVVGLMVAVLGVAVIAFGSFVFVLVSSGPIYDADEECARATGVPVEPRRTNYTVERVRRFPVDWRCVETSTGRTGRLYGPDSTWLPVGLVAAGAGLVVTPVVVAVRSRRRGVERG